MHNVDQLFKQHEVIRDRSHPCADEDAIELLPLELVDDNQLSRFAKIGQA